MTLAIYLSIIFIILNRCEDNHRLQYYLFPRYIQDFIIVISKIIII